MNKFQTKQNKGSSGGNNEIESRSTIQKVSKTKSWFLKKINTMYKTLDYRKQDETKKNMCELLILRAKARERAVTTESTNIQE